MGQALYRKYRSKSLDEVIGQEHITVTLSNALKKDMVSHAYLFTGPRGVGKTSVARILAHEANGLPYEDDQTHLDIIEIDAASNRRIDEIRELRERVHIAPTSAKYKVYIVDEVHMLTKEAFNALLKTLEEPPAHVIFILATTEAHKLPATIVSRTQRFSFKPIDANEVITHLRNIANKESIEISDDALQLIAQHGEGSFRDSISLLDQARNLGKKNIELLDIQQLLGIAPKEMVANLLKLLADGSAKELLNYLVMFRDQGFQPEQVAKQLAAVLRVELLGNEPALEPHIIAKLLQKLVGVPASHDPESLLEVILLKTIIAHRTLPEATPSLTKPKKQMPPAVAADTPKPAKVDNQQESPFNTDVAAESDIIESEQVVIDESAELWDATLQVVKQQYPTLYSVARMAVPHLAQNKLTLTFKFPFHQKRLNESRNKQVITDILSQKAGKAIALSCTVGNIELNVQKPEGKPADKLPIDSINNIFGGGEMLES